MDPNLKAFLGAVALSCFAFMAGFVWRWMDVPVFYEPATVAMCSMACISLLGFGYIGYIWQF